MPVPDFFAPDNFSLTSFTQAINKIPNMYGRVRDLGIFTPDPIITTTASVEEMNGVLNLVPSRERGAPGNVNISGKRKTRGFKVPHFPLDDVVLPEEVQNVRAFGTENVAETVAGVYSRKLAEMRAKHAITLEHLRVKALQGLVLDYDGSTLYNWFTEFGITQTTVAFVLATTSTEVMAKCNAVKRAMDLALLGEVMSGARGLCSPGFFDALTTHTSVKAAFANYSAAQQRLGGDNRSGFTFGGITWEEYNGSATDSAGNTRLFIPTDEAIVFPEGTLSTFSTIMAPGNYMEAVNTPGQELYARGVVRPKGDGIDIFTEMNVLPICKRPGVLIKVTKA